MIAAEEFLQVIEEGFDPPSDRKNAQDRFRVRFQQAADEIARLLEGGIRTRTNHQNLAGTQLSDKGAYPMHKHRTATRSRGPHVLGEVLGCQGCGIRVQGNVDPLALRILAAHLAVAFEAAADAKAALL